MQAAHSHKASRTRSGIRVSTNPAGSSYSSSVLNPPSTFHLEDKGRGQNQEKIGIPRGHLSDNFIRTTPYEALLKTETTAMKISEFKRNKAVSLRLSNNRDNLS